MNNTGTQTFILECSRINSVGVRSGGEDFNNKSSWTNKTAPILLKQGDNVSLQNVLINVGGADTNAIQFQAAANTLDYNLQDNFTLLETGFYINHNGIYTAALPVKYASRADRTENFLTESSITVNAGGVTNRTNNNLGLFENYQYFIGDGTGNIPDDDLIAKISDIESLNPNNPMNGSKFAIIHPDYAGWMRANDNNASDADKVDNIKLLTSEIPILIPQGFSSPTGIANLITNTLSYTDQDFRNSANLYTATANKFKQDDGSNTNKTNLKQYMFNGYTYKTINCNLQGKNHKIYGCMAVDEPYLWLYGTSILSNAETDDMQANKRYFNQDENPDDARVNYPSIIWQRFIGNDPTNFDLGIEGRTGQYSNYSPFKTTIQADQNNTEIIEIQGLDSTFSAFNDFFNNQSSTENDGFWLAQISSTSFRQVKNSVIGTDIDKFALFVDNDATDVTRIVGYKRFPTLKGNWPAEEHQIFKTTDIGQPGRSNPYQFSGAGAGQPSEVWFAYTDVSNRIIFMGQDDGGLGFTGYVYISNLLTPDSGGIVEGGEYSISFILTIQDGSDWSNTSIGVGGNGVGLSFQTFNSDGLKEVSFTATASSIASNAIAFGVYYSNIGAVVMVSDISIKRENLNQDDLYSVSNAWNNNTSNPEDNKIFSITKNSGLSNLQTTLTDNVTHTYFNRTYTVIARGLIANFTNGNFVCSTNLTSHDPNVAMLYNDDETDYTFWIFQTSNPDLWVLYRLEKYQGGIPEHNTILGAIDGAGIQLKNPNRAGQQYYDFSVSNTWSGSTKNILKTIPNPFDTTSTFTFDPTGADVHYTYYADDAFQFEYLANETQTWKYVQSILTETVQANETFTISFDITNVSNPGNALSQPFRFVTSYLEGAVNYNPRDFTAEGNHSFTFTTTQAPFNQSTCMYWGFFNNHPNSGDEVRISNFTIERQENISITSHIAQTLPTVDTGSVAGVVQYFASFNIHVSYGPNQLTLYMGANNNGEGNDTDKEGERGRLVWQDSGNWYASTWDWNGGAYIDLNIDGGISIYYQGAAPSLTNIVQYETSQNFVVNSDTYAVPVDGKQYGFGYQLYGSTSSEIATGGTMYLGFDNTTQPNDTLEVLSGFVYDNLTDPFANNNGKKWAITENTADNEYTLKITSAIDGVTILTLISDGEGYLSSGWILTQTDKILDSEIRDSGTDGNILNNCTPLGWFTKSTSNILLGQVGPDTNGTTGINYAVYTDGDISGTGADSGTFITHQGAQFVTETADMKTHQLLMTNLVMTTGNLDKVKDFFRYTETYNGSNLTRTDISQDVRNFYTTMDLGRGNDGIVDNTNTEADSNTTGQTPLVPGYMRDGGIMGHDGDANDTKNMGCVCPMRKYGDNENRIKVYTGFQDLYEDRIIADGMYGDLIGNNNNYCYGNSLTSKQFQTGYKNPVDPDEFIDTSEFYNKCKNENIGVIPFINKQTGKPMIGFELFENYDGSIYKIQNLTYFTYSPSVTDHNYVTIFNNDAPSIKDNDYNFTANILDQMNFINVGASQPSFEYNEDVNKFTIRYFHTPTFLNKETGTETNISQEVAKIFDNAANVIFRDLCFQRNTFKLADDNRRNIGINDSQSGIFIKDVYFQKVQQDQKTITNINDALAVKMSSDNFYNTLWFKLGFSYYDLRPIKFTFSAFNKNRFSNLAYNNTSDAFKEYGLVPFTTNSLLSINDAPALNIFTQNSGDESTKSDYFGTQIYGLGYNNNLSAVVQVESDSLFPASIPVNISSAYYRIYTDLPIDTLTYTSESKLNVIGSALLNYASSQQFFFSYGMDYGATITKDTLINNIKIEIRDDRGQLIQGLGDRSLVVVKITRAIQLQNTEVNPEQNDEPVSAPGQPAEATYTENPEQIPSEVPEDYPIPIDVPVAEKEQIAEKIAAVDEKSVDWFNKLKAPDQRRAVAIEVGANPTPAQITEFDKEYKKLPVRQRVAQAEKITKSLNIPEPEWFKEADELEQMATQERRQTLIGEEGQELEEGTERMATIDKIPSSQELETFINNLNTQIIKANIERVIIQQGEAELDIYTARDISTQLARLYASPNFQQELTYVINTIKQFGIDAALSDDRVINFIDNQAELALNVEGKPVISEEDLRKQVTVSDQTASELYSTIQALTGEKEGVIVNKLEPIVANQIADEGIQIKNVRVPGRKGTGINLTKYSNADNFLEEYVNMDEKDLELIKESADAETINKLYRNMTKFLLSNDEEGYLRNAGQFTRLVNDVVGKQEKYQDKLNEMLAWGGYDTNIIEPEKRAISQRVEKGESGPEKQRIEIVYDKGEPEKREPERRGTQEPAQKAAPELATEPTPRLVS